MAIGKNLKPTHTHQIKLFKIFRDKNRRKVFIYSFILILVLFGLYGALNLVRLAPKEEERQDLVFDTGDRPLPEEIKIWINAKGGLNMRSEPSKESQIVKIIPNGTELTAIELSGDWYKVSYDGKIGWVHRDFIKTFKEEESNNLSGDWKSYKSAAYSFNVKYPKDWVYLSYGANTAANLLDYIAFGLQLSDQLDPAILPPIVVKVTSDSDSVVMDLYNKKTESKKEPVTISSKNSVKYTYISSSGVQMTAFVVSSGKYTYILEESGGYADELNEMAKGFNFL
ncbi:MAG: SH3 domain-containing protein [Patescibacteria group bacterium]|nr:SH3 domain-containing protein [Patescibacteria group bacterium]